MKLGMIHVLRDRTWDHVTRREEGRLRENVELWRRLGELSRERDELARENAALCRQRDDLARDNAELRQGLDAASAENAELKRRVKLYTRHGFMHVLEKYRTAPGWILDPDDEDAPRTREAVRRVIEAYHRAMADFVPPGRGLWQGIEANAAKAAFFTALRQRDERTVGHWLTRMFRTDLIWGLGRVHESAPADICDDPRRSWYLAQITDTLLSLAQACGVRPVVSIQHQGFGAYQSQGDLDLHELMAEIERRTGLDPSLPQVGAGYGCRVYGKLINPDSLLHTYTVHRLRQLGADPDARLAEIGGGYGCLAYLLHRAGLRNVEVFDLPWVNVLQGYFLIQSLPPGSVRLYGEEQGDVRVTPYWHFTALPDRSVDYVVNTDSLPEMALEDRRAYLAHIARTLGGCFLSINQESGVQIETYDPQSGVGPLAEQTGGLRLLSRHLWWMYQGYVEEVFGPDVRG
jgi:hypothetical protein